MGNNGGRWMLNLGLLLIAAALYLSIYNLNEARQASRSAVDVIGQLSQTLPTAPEEPEAAEAGTGEPEEAEESQEVELPEYLRDPDREMPAKTVNGQEYIGVLEIPALELELPIISQWSYPRLRIAPCRYSGSVYSGDLIIAAHNYSTHFGRLKTLAQGERVLFTDMEGTVFTYQVAALETLQPMATEEMESGDWDLTLFTCTVGGQSRVTVRCVLEKD